MKLPVLHDLTPEKRRALPTGETLKTHGTQRALCHAPEEWKRLAVAWVYAQPIGSIVTSEDVTRAVGLPHRTTMNRNNAVGAIINALAREGTLRPTGEYIKSSAVASHAAVIQRWRVDRPAYARGRR